MHVIFTLYTTALLLTANYLICNVMRCDVMQDSSVCRRMLGKVLQSLSITYEEAEDGVQAVEKVQLSLSLSQKKLNTATSATEINLSDSTRNSAGRKCFDLILVSSLNILFSRLFASRNSVGCILNTNAPLRIDCCICVTCAASSQLRVYSATDHRHCIFSAITSCRTCAAPRQ